MEIDEYTETVTQNESMTCSPDITQKQKLSESPFLEGQQQQESVEEPSSPDSPASSPGSEQKSPVLELTEGPLDQRRSRKSAKRNGHHCCPVCGVTLRDSELRAHFERELDRLTKVHRNHKKPKHEESGINMTFVQVKCNRENRLTAKVSKYAAKAKKEVQCPVCNLKMSGCEEDINKHVALCVQNEEDSDDIVVDDDDDESFEEYEIGDETRIRAISLVPGGHRGLQGLAPRTQRREDDEDLDVVDVDDTLAYGQPQYTELDVITNTSEEDESQEQLRKAVLMDPTVQPLVLESRKWSSINDVADQEDSRVCSTDHIVASLKEKIKDLEEQNKNVRCLICMEAYTKPVVSTTCWHVHCEECWLVSMGNKKLCPQCNMIVFPSDLRRIFL